MAQPALQKALEKVGGGDVAVQAPEWSNHSGLTLAARTFIAVLLFAFTTMIVVNVGDELPGESGTQDETLSTSFASRATAASDAAARSLKARLRASQRMKQSRAEVSRARQLTPPDAAAVSSATEERARAREALTLARRKHQQRVAEQSVALEAAADLNREVAVRPSSDVDLVRAIGLAALALLALLGSVALLVPRRMQLLTIRSLLTTPGNATTGTQGATEAVHEVESVPASSKTGIASTEPALTQGFFAAAALVAGLYGIQQYEGAAEVALNAALPLVPIVGALFARNRVAAQPHIQGAERVRLFPPAQ